MGRMCGGRFVLAIDRGQQMFLSLRGEFETDATIRACAEDLRVALSCAMPYHRLGWQCSAHNLPTPAGMGGPLELGQEIGLVLDAVAAAGCGRRIKEPEDRVEVERVAYGLEGTEPTTLVSRWRAASCGGTWTTETRCVREPHESVGVCEIAPLVDVTPAPGDAAAPAGR